MFSKFIFIGIFSFLLISCGDDDSDNVAQSNCNVTALTSTALYFDEMKLTGFNQNFDGKLHFEYDSQNRISKVNGALRGSGSLNSLGVNYAFDNDLFDLVTYEGDSVKVDYSANFVLQPYDKTFLIQDNKIKFRKVTGLDNFYNTVTRNYYYEYNGNQINEIINGVIIRTFHIENENLVKVEKHFNAGSFITRAEYVFLNFDENENLLQGKFFINGYFFRAFSRNNFRRIEYKEYILVDGVEQLYDDSYYSVEFTSDPGSVATIFETNCN